MSGTVSGPDIGGLDPLVPSSPEIGVPEGTKARGSRVDFRDTQFDLLVETKGLRVAWSQAAACPCVGINRQTDQPDPNCTVGCGGTGFVYFRPPNYAVSGVPAVGQLTGVQRHLIDRPSSPAVVIRVVSIGMERRDTPYDRIGQWGQGTVNVTVRKNHVLGHYDRLTYLDSVLAYAQTVIVPDPSQPFRLRYPALRVNFMRTVEARYVEGDDFTLDEEGRVCFASDRAPAGANVLLSVHYVHHPQFLVMSYLNAVRDSIVVAKRASSRTRTPQGDVQKLPTRVMAQLEFLADLGAR